MVRALRELTGFPVLVVPAGAPDHRPPPQATAAQRAEMVDLAVRTLADPAVSVCRREVEWPGPTFTVDTVEWLGREQPELTLILALGSDAAAGLPAWKRVRRLLGQVQLLVFDRQGAERNGPEVLAQLRRRGLPLAGARAVTLAAPAVAAIEIRAQLATGASCAHLLSPGVAAYIREHGLYQ